MAQPDVYTPAHSFVADSANIPNFPGQNIDVELAEIAEIFAEYHTNLALLQNDDGTVKNGLIGIAQLTTDVQAQLGNVAAIAAMNALATQCAANAVSTAANVVSTHADVVTTAASVTAAAASATLAAASAAGTGITGLTNHGIAISHSTTSVNVSVVLTDGQLIVGASGADPVAKTVSGDATLAASGALTLASGAGTRTNLGLAIGTNVQAFDAQLFSNIPQNSQIAAYTTVLTDSGKHVYHPSSDNNPRTFTIDSNANVAYVVGTVITFVNEINTVTIAITSDTLTLAGAGTTGSRTLAANGMATAIKVAATKWVINGTGLT